MNPFDRSSKKKLPVWKKALIHSCLCFVMGFFTGFAPTTITSERAPLRQPVDKVSVLPQAIGSLHKSAGPRLLNQSLVAQLPDRNTPNPTLDIDTDADEQYSAYSNPRGLLIIITTTRSGDPTQLASLTRLAYTFKLVAPPLLWILIESHEDAPETARMLRETGTLYRHVTYKENFTDFEEEEHHQRNVALSHIEDHRLTGIVHFADLSNFYDLQFFEEMREIEVFGTWPVATITPNMKKVKIEGPICKSSKVVGWFSEDSSEGTATVTALAPEAEEFNSNSKGLKPNKINISGFGFNSSILWDPERWGRPTSSPDTSQDSMEFVQEVFLQDESRLKGIPPDCSQVMTWHVHMLESSIPPQTTQKNKRR